MANYQVIYADPCWPYNARRNKNTKFGGGVHGHYDVMTEQELCQMGNWINSIADSNCALFMWATGPRTDMAIRVATSWGFRFATAKAFTWIKVAKKIKLPYDVKLPGNVVLPAGTTIPFQALGERTALGLTTIVGPGNYTGSNTEDCMLFIKGKMKPINKLVPQIVLHPRMKHSKKPPEVRDRIVRMFGDVPRIELFARERAPGWDANGLELDGTDYTKLSSIVTVQGTHILSPAA